MKENKDSWIAHARKKHKRELISSHLMFDSRREAKTEINVFFQLHPNSKSKFVIEREIFYWIREEK